MFDDSVFKATNTALLELTYQKPPPPPVLFAVIETVGGEPDALAVLVEGGREETTWEVFACRGDIIARVYGRAPIPGWAGSNADRAQVETHIEASARRITDLRAIEASDIKAPPTWEGFSRQGTATWTLRFKDGDAIVLNEDGEDGWRVRDVARYVRDRFSHATPRQSS